MSAPWMKAHERRAIYKRRRELLDRRGYCREALARLASARSFYRLHPKSGTARRQFVECLHRALEERGWREQARRWYNGSRDTFIARYGVGSIRLPKE